MLTGHAGRRQRGGLLRRRHAALLRLVGRHGAGLGRGDGRERTASLAHGFGVNALVLDDAEGWLAYGAVDGGTRIVAPDDRPGHRRLHRWTAGRSWPWRCQPDGGPARGGRRRGLHHGGRHRGLAHRAAISAPRHAARSGRWPSPRMASSILAGGLDDTVHSWPIETMTEHGADGRGGHAGFLRRPDEMSNGERQFRANARSATP